MSTKPKWRARLQAIALAGGATVLAGCPAIFPGGTCNANPDPCCSAPEGLACATKKACESSGGSFGNNGGAGTCFTDDAGVPADLSAHDEPDLLVTDAAHD